MNISVQELLSLPSPNIIDIRPVQNYNNNHIPGAINVPYNNLVISPDKYLKRNEVYYIYCKHGQTSKGLTQFLNKQGYKTYNVIGGYDAWVLQS